MPHFFFNCWSHNNIGWDMCVAFDTHWCRQYWVREIRSEPECTRKMNLCILWDAAHVHVIWCTTLLVKLLKYLKQKLLLLCGGLAFWPGWTKARKNELSDFWYFCNKVMKHALDRTLLQSYFLSSDESQARFQHALKAALWRPHYWSLPSAVIPAFTTFNNYILTRNSLYLFTSWQARIISEETSWQVCEGYCTAGCKWHNCDCTEENNCHGFMTKQILRRLRDIGTSEVSIL